MVQTRPWLRFGLFIFLLGLLFAPFSLVCQARTGEVEGRYESIERHHGEEALGRMKAALDTYQSVAIAGGVVLVLIASLLTRKSPLVSAFFPSVGFTLYVFFVLSPLQRALPPETMLDNKPTVFLFVLCTGMQVLLLGYVWKGWGYRVDWDGVRITRHYT
jgi:hypothetical protein